MISRAIAAKPVEAMAKMALKAIELLILPLLQARKVILAAMKNKRGRTIHQNFIGASLAKNVV